jgi:hypothetical protein
MPAHPATPSQPVVVVGAGAAGLVAAIVAADAGCAVTLLERTSDAGRKILISGGGRCNVLPERLEPRRFVTSSPVPLVQRFLRSWPLEAQRRFFETDVGIALKLEAESRKWFPVSDRARDVRDGLVDLAGRRGVQIRFNTDLVDLRQTNDGWRVETTVGDLDATAVVVATGGLSVPSTGSTGTGLTLAAALGHIVHETYPALTPLTAEPACHARLSGVSVQVRLRAASAGGHAEAQGGFLFTHRGYSGPAVLDVSHVAVRSRTAAPRASLRVKWCEMDEQSWQQALTAASGLILTTLAKPLPQRLAEQILIESGIPLDRRGAELRRQERSALVNLLVNYPLPWTGDEGYKKAEVTGGGVALDEVDPRTLESRRHRGLFFCGEMLDAFGPIGGHNFAWAWATGRLAGLGASQGRGRAIPPSL